MHREHKQLQMYRKAPHLNIQVSKPEDPAIPFIPFANTDKQRKEEHAPSYCIFPSAAFALDPLDIKSGSTCSWMGSLSIS